MQVYENRPQYAASERFSKTRYIEVIVQKT